MIDPNLAVCLFGLDAMSPIVQELAENGRRNAELLGQAMFITKKSAKEIRAAAAQSPLSFADFVQQLKAGHRI